ncbi:MAG TPA: Hsp70 family protein, partial [Terracidiphilus sp.]|nr:Hsp70 family protein [Terracidiphilus sp.]
EAHAAEDKEKRDEVEARNGLDSLVYNIEKMLKDASDKIQGAEKTEVESALANAKKTLEGQGSVAEMNAAQEKLTQASHKLAEVLYKANAAQATTAGTPAGETAAHDAGAKKEGEVIDAEYVDVDEKK